MIPSIGPVEFILLGFEGNHLTGDIAPALANLVEDGTVRLLDLAVIMKDPAGEVMILEMQELPEDVAEAMRKIVGDVRGLMSEADLIEVAENLEPNSTVAALLVEHIWATRFADAVRSAGGELLLSVRIAGDLVDEARRTLQSAAELS